MTIKEVYEKVGDYQAVLQRFLKDELIIHFALKFTKDMSYQKLKDAVETGNINDAFSAAHTLKGVAGNVGFTKLEKATSDLTEQLRPLNNPVDLELVKAVDAAYEEVMNTLKELQ